MKTHSRPEKRIYRYLYVPVVVLYTIISIFFILNTYPQNQKNRKENIALVLDKEASIVSEQYNAYAHNLALIFGEIKADTQLLAATQSEKIVEIQSILEERYYRKLDNFGVNISLFSPQGMVFGNDVALPHKQEIFSIADVDAYHLNPQIAFSSNGCTLMFSSTFNANPKIKIVLTSDSGLIYNSLLNISGSVFAFIEQPILAKDKDFITKSSICFSGQNARSILASLESKLDFKKTSQEVKVEGKRYGIARIVELHSIDKPHRANIFYSIDITPIHKAHAKQLANLIVSSAIILVLIVITLLIFRKKILQAVFYLKEELSSHLKARINEVVDMNDHFKQILESTTNGIRVIDTEFNVVQVNKAFCRIAGGSNEKLTEQKCYNIFPSTKCHTEDCPLERLKTEEIVESSKEMRTSLLNERVIFHYQALPLKGKNGEFLGIVENFKDVTQEEKEKQEFIESKIQLESFLNSMPVGAIIRDFDGYLHYQNEYMRKAFDILDYEKKNIKYLFPSAQVDRFFEEDKFLETKGSVVVEEQLIDTNKVERTYVTHKFKFLGAKNQSLVGAVSIDISKRKLAEHNAYVLTKAINGLPIGIVITTPEGYVETCNPEMERFTNQDMDILVGSSFPGFNKADNLPILSNAINKALLGSLYQGEMFFSIYRGEQRWYDISVSPVFNRHGEVAHIIFAMVDITQRKEYEKEIQIAKSKAIESDRLKSAFLANLSHEVRTPLNAIQGFSTLLQNDTISAEEKKEIPGQLQKNSCELLAIIENLIDIAAIESEQLDVHNREFKLNKLVQESFDECLGLNLHSSVKTIIKLGISDENFTIRTDPNRLSQVIKHLLSNAIKFTKNGFIELGYTRKDENNLLFYVIDSGIGLSPEEQEFIFKPFRQADESFSRSFGGLGIGLSISKSIIEKLGGKLWVTSTKNQGSTFFFTLPFESVKPKFERTLTSSETKEFNWQDKTIMIADDIDSNYEFIKALIKPTGAELIWARNGQEAVDLVKSRAIDVILMDIVMPEVDGFEATKIIKGLKSDIKVICQTAYPSPENRQASIDSGMDSFLQKPISARKMLSTINDFFIS